MTIKDGQYAYTVSCINLYKFVFLNINIRLDIIQEVITNIFDNGLKYFVLR